MKTNLPETKRKKYEECYSNELKNQYLLGKSLIQYSSLDLGELFISGFFPVKENEASTTKIVKNIVMINSRYKRKRKNCVK